MGSYRRYSDTEKAAAVQLVRDGKTVRSVAERLGASRQTVSRWCHEAGVATGRGAPAAPKPVRTEAALLVRSGQTVKAVATRFGVSRGSVRNWVAEFNASRGDTPDLTAEQIVEMVTHGVSIGKVARRAGLTVDAVERILRRVGVSR